MKAPAAGPFRQGEPQFRVFRISKEKREWIGKRRRQLGMRVVDAAQAAIHDALPGLVEQLRAIGFHPPDKTAAIRWPLSTAQLEALASAADATGVPQGLLFELALMRVLAEHGEAESPPIRRRRRGKASGKAG